MNVHIKYSAIVDPNKQLTSECLAMGDAIYHPLTNNQTVMSLAVTPRHPLGRWSEVGVEDTIILLY